MIYHTVKLHFCRSRHIFRKFEERESFYENQYCSQLQAKLAVITGYGSAVLLSLRACLHGGEGPQIGEVTCVASPHLSCKRDQIKMRDDMDRQVTPPMRVTSPGGTPLYKPYRYVPSHRVGFLRRFCLKTGIHFAHFGLESGMVFEGTTDQCI